MLGSEKTLTCAPCNNNVGFLQRTNSLEDKGRIVSSLKEKQSSKSLLACENSEKESRFRRTETDFSNLYARGKHFTVSPCSSSGMSLSSPALISPGSAAMFRPCFSLAVFERSSVSVFFGSCTGDVCKLPEKQFYVLCADHLQLSFSGSRGFSRSSIQEESNSMFLSSLVK